MTTDAVNRSSATTSGSNTPKTGGFHWRDEFTLGHADIDAMHHEFSDVLNQLLLSDDDELADTLDAFLEHAHRHFEQEARQMRETRYSGASCHLEEHGAVLASGEQVRLLLEAGNRHEARRYATELARWFPKHSDEMDRSLAHWLLTRRADGRLPVKIIRKPVQPHNPGPHTDQG
jgi:hemerythrin-like metal-binding protein